MGLDANGQPVTGDTSSLAILESVNHSGEAKDMNRQGIFSFNLDKEPNGSCRLSASHYDQDGNQIEDTYTNDPFTAEHPDLAAGKKVLTTDAFQQITGEAGQVFQSLQGSEPVNYRPAPPK